MVDDLLKRCQWFLFDTDVTLDVEDGKEEELDMKDEESEEEEEEEEEERAGNLTIQEFLDDSKTVDENYKTVSCWYRMLQ